jgi:hypothetical protein
MPYPDDFNSGLFKSAYESPDPSESEVDYEIACYKAAEAASYAWQAWPLSTDLHADERWALLRPNCFEKARTLLNKHVTPNEKDLAELKDELERAKEYNDEHDVYAFRQALGSYLHVFWKRIEPHLNDTGKPYYYEDKKY